MGGPQWIRKRSGNRFRDASRLCLSNKNNHIGQTTLGIAISVATSSLSTQRNSQVGFTSGHPISPCADPRFTWLAHIPRLRRWTAPPLTTMNTDESRSGGNAAAPESAWLPFGLGWADRGLKSRSTLPARHARAGAHYASNSREIKKPPRGAAL
jgi:hypothetical protein